MIKVVTEFDIGRRVVYRAPPEFKPEIGLLVGMTKEQGMLFVSFPDTGRAQICPQADLEWESDVSSEGDPPDWSIWLWWVGPSEEVFHVCYRTEEEARERCRKEGGGYIVKARTEPVGLDRFFNVHEEIDRAINLAQEHMGPSGDQDPYQVIDARPDQWLDLERRILATIRGWQIHHGLLFKPAVFTEASEIQYVSGSENPFEEPADGGAAPGP